MRRPIFAANWKMHKTRAEASAFVDAFVPLVKGAQADVVLAPPFPSLDVVARGIEASNVVLAAQNVNAEEKGAFTGEVAPGITTSPICEKSFGLPQ